MIRVYLQQTCVPIYRRQLFELLSERQDAHFTILAGAEPDVPFLKTVNLGDSKIRMHVCPGTWFKIPGFPVFSFQPSAVRAVLRDKPDVIIAGGVPYWLTSWALLLAGRLIRRPVLLWTHGLLQPESGPKWWLRRAFYRLADGLLLYGNHARRLLQAEGFDPQRIHVVYNSLDCDEQFRVANALTEEELFAFRRALDVQLGEGLVGFVGRLQPRKQLDQLIEAVAILNRRGKRVHVALVGEGTERNRLQTLAEKLGVEDLVHFVGFQPEERQVGLVLSASDLCVIPSWAGLSVMHALAYGTPVVTHDLVAKQSPEWEAVEDGRTGFFYKYNDVNDMADKIEAALFPTPAKAKMREACSAMIRDRYNPSRHAEEFINALRLLH